MDVRAKLTVGRSEMKPTDEWDLENDGDNKLCVAMCFPIGQVQLAGSEDGHFQ